MIHICTTDSLMCDAVDIGEGECPVCLRTSRLKLGWIGIKCMACKHVTSSDSPGVTVRARRKMLGLTRAQMAELAGVRPKTIGVYERYQPSRRYWEQTRNMMIAVHSDMEGDDEN